MKQFTLNPVTALKNYLDNKNQIQTTGSTNQQSLAPAVVPISQPLAPASDTNGHIVQGTFIDAGSMQALMTTVVANAQRSRQLVESFDEDREPVVEKGIRWFYMGIFYVMPALVAYFVGRAIGDEFSGNHGLDWNDGWNAFNHVISWAIEFSISGLVLAASIAARKIRSSTSEYVGLFVMLAIALVFFSVASGVAQYVLVEVHLNPHPGVEQAAAIFRVSAGPAVDICSLMFLSVMRFKSLKKHLHDMEQKRIGIHAANQAEIALQAEQMKAALDMQQSLSDLTTKAKRAEIWNELERMQGQSMIENARRTMQGDGTEGGYYRRSRY